MASQGSFKVVRYSITVANNNMTLSDEAVISLITFHLPVDCASITPKLGIWNGSVEKSWTIDIIDLDDDISKHQIYNFCRDLREQFKQACVLLTTSETKGELI